MRTACYSKQQYILNLPVLVQVWQALYGCDCYAYGLLAAGFCDLVVEADLKPYDYMAQVPIIQGAGGVITDWQVALCSSAEIRL